ncbi:hypothetical protein H0G86_002791 [Trichoderma simmonsii]|uniref:Uncharacterized protein n=1 Tax=Trichoderma simmonsii TaxID=1491479 RepID=A0A8G0L7C2_9HYPO|nr:hypothetical protein H0G86_002791 [Trichoderma simmonsii]
MEIGGEIVGEDDDSLPRISKGTCFSMGNLPSRGLEGGNFVRKRGKFGEEDFETGDENPTLGHRIWPGASLEMPSPGREGPIWDQIQRRMSADWTRKSLENGKLHQIHFAKLIAGPIQGTERGGDDPEGRQGLDAEKMGNPPTAGDRNEDGPEISPETNDAPRKGDERRGSRWLGKDNEDENQDGEELDLLIILAGAANWQLNGFRERDTEEILEAAICMGKSEIKGDPLEFEKPHTNGPDYQVPLETLILADYQEDFLGLDMDKMGQRANLVQFLSFKADLLPDRKPHTFRPLAVVSPEKIVS